MISANAFKHFIDKLSKQGFKLSVAQQSDFSSSYVNLDIIGRPQASNSFWEHAENSKVENDSIRNI